MGCSRKQTSKVDMIERFWWEGIPAMSVSGSPGFYSATSIGMAGQF